MNHIYLSKKYKLKTKSHIKLQQITSTKKPKNDINFVKLIRKEHNLCYDLFVNFILIYYGYKHCISDIYMPLVYIITFKNHTR